jgi:putative effector of murein hydrolase LrgA (UPF0299 family)
VFGGAKVWSRLDLNGIAIMGLGGLIALGTRQYVGWFLIAGGLALIVHAALRQLGSMRSLSLIYGVVAIVFVATPTLLQASSPKSLRENIEGSQIANATSTGGNGAPNGNNLALEKVDFSTRAAIVANLPNRIRDLLFRPYPWQVGDVNQALGVLGSLVALTCFYLLIRFAVLARRQILARAGPLLYPFFFLLIPYALSVGNAGTGFRYRTHLVTLAFAAMVVLRAAALERRKLIDDLPLGGVGTNAERPLLASPGNRADGRALPAF